MIQHLVYNIMGTAQAFNTNVIECTSLIQEMDGCSTLEVTAASGEGVATKQEVVDHQLQEVPYSHAIL